MSYSPPPSPLSEDDTDNNYHPLDSPKPARRGRKPTSGSKAARDQQRKSNHSLIERRRRDKINEALAALRDLVPSGTARPGPSDDVLKPSKKEKDFKLEVLTRTVTYMRDCVDRIGRLEAQLAAVQSGAALPVQQQQQPSGSCSCATKRKREQDDVGDRKHRLPPIASLLNPQLPSPPLTRPMPPTIVADIPPVLALPDAGRGSSRASWTPDDENAASLLLRMASRPEGAVQTPPESSLAMTPGVMLGMSGRRHSTSSA